MILQTNSKQLSADLETSQYQEYTFLFALPVIQHSSVSMIQDGSL
jgi:hypothetical protein